MTILRPPQVLAIGGGLLFLAPLFLAAPVFRGLEGVFVDDPIPPASEIAKLAADSTQYLVALASGVLGLFGLLMSERISELSDRLNPRWRRLSVLGAVSCGASLWTGFVAMQVIMQAAADGVVRFALDGVKWLHLIQLIEVATGLGLVASSVLWAFVRHGEKRAT